MSKTKAWAGLAKREGKPTMATIGVGKDLEDFKINIFDKVDECFEVEAYDFDNIDQDSALSFFLACIGKYDDFLGKKLKVTISIEK